MRGALVSVRPVAVLDAHVGESSFEFSPTSEQLAYLDFTDDGTNLSIYALKEQKVVRTLKWSRSAKSMAFSHDGAKLALTVEDDIRVWDWAKDKHVTWPESLSTRSPARVARFGVTNDVVYVGDKSGEWRGGVRTWDLHKGTLAVVFEPDLPRGRNEIGAGTAMTASQDGSMLAITFAKNIVLIDTKTNKVVKRADNPNDSGRDLRFSADGQFLLKGGMNKKVTLWSVPELKELATYDVGNGVLWACDFLTDGRVLILATLAKHNEYQFILWNGVKNEEVWRIDCAKGNNLFQGFRVSPDGKWLALGFDPSNVNERRMTLWKMDDILRLAAGKGDGRK